MDRTPISLLINCGYARVAVFEFSAVKRGKSRFFLNREERAEKFQKVFANCSSFARPDEYWVDTVKSNFNRHCDYILDCFTKKWNSNSTRVQYLETFSTKNWEAIPLEKKVSAFPCYEPESLIEINLPSSSSNTATIKESVATCKVMAELNKSYELSFNYSFTESLLKHCSESEGIVCKESAVVKKEKEEICNEVFVQR